MGPEALNMLLHAQPLLAYWESVMCAKEEPHLWGTSSPWGWRWVTAACTLHTVSPPPLRPQPPLEVCKAEPWDSLVFSSFTTSASGSLRTECALLLPWSKHVSFPSWNLPWTDPRKEKLEDHMLPLNLLRTESSCRPLEWESGAEYKDGQHYG